MTKRAIMAFVLQFLRVPLRLRCRLPVGFFAGEDRPDEPGRLIWHRKRRAPNGFAIKKLHDPGVYPFREPTGTLDLRRHPDHQFGDVGIVVRPAGFDKSHRGDSIGLAARHVRFDVGRGHRAHIVANGPQCARPMMR